MTQVADLYRYPDQVDAFGFDWGQLSVTLGPGVNGATKMSAAVVTVPPGQGHARHNHPGSEEIIFILRGEGEQMVEDEQGQPYVQKVYAGCTVFIPESRFHSTLNTGPDELQIFVVYAPAGPEELLKELPDFRLIPRKG